MKRDPFDWPALTGTFLALCAEEKRVRAQRTGLDELNRLINLQQKLIARAASQVPSKGVAAELIQRALISGDFDEGSLAARVLLHLRQFPRRFTAPLVRFLILQMRETTLPQVCETHGWKPIMEEIRALAVEGVISEEFFSFLVFYVRSNEEDSTLSRDERAQITEDILARIRERSHPCTAWIRR